MQLYGVHEYVPSRTNQEAEVFNLYYYCAFSYTQDDETALHIAAYHGHVEVIKVLTANQDRFLINARDQVSSHFALIKLKLIA